MHQPDWMMGNRHYSGSDRNRAAEFVRLRAIRTIASPAKIRSNMSCEVNRVQKHQNSFQLRATCDGR